MTLTYQLFRGCLALALLGVLSLAALVAPAAESRHAVAVATTAATLPVPPPAMCALPTPPLRVALAPADLGSFGRRHDEDCRA